jgi:hypothetical protein
VKSNSPFFPSKGHRLGWICIQRKCFKVPLKSKAATITLAAYLIGRSSYILPVDPRLYHILGRYSEKRKRMVGVRVEEGRFCGRGAEGWLRRISVQKKVPLARKDLLALRLLFWWPYSKDFKAWDWTSVGGWMGGWVALRESDRRHRVRLVGSR